MTTYLNVEGVANGTDTTAGNSQMTPVVTGGTVKVSSATYTSWPVDGKTRSVEFDAQNISGGTFSSVTPATPSGPVQWIQPFRFPTAPPIAMVIMQPRHSGSGAAMSIMVNAAGNVIVQNSAGTTVHTSTVTLTFPGVYRIGAFVSSSASTGQIKLRVWDAVGTMIYEWISPATQNTSANQITSFRTGSKINSGSAVWKIQAGQLELLYNNVTDLTLSPPLATPIPNSTVLNGWLYDTSSDPAGGTLTISAFALTPTRAFIVDQANRRIAVETSSAPATYSYRVTSSVTGLFADVTGTLAATQGAQSPAMRLRRTVGGFVELL